MNNKQSILKLFYQKLCLYFIRIIYKTGF